jgi:hypothetical protein
MDPFRRKSGGGRGAVRLKRAPIVPVPRVAASPAQRRKVATLGCAVCGRRPVDPAHLVPQRLGGCASPDCVIALCRTHHRLYDGGGLALAPYLGRGFRRERAHALSHAGASALQRALKGGGWPPPHQMQINKRRS